MCGLSRSPMAAVLASKSCMGELASGVRPPDSAKNIATLFDTSKWVVGRGCRRGCDVDDVYLRWFSMGWGREVFSGILVPGTHFDRIDFNSVVV